MGSAGNVGDGVHVFFQSRRAGVEANLAAQLTDFIAQTRQTLDIAAYDLRHPAVLEALSRVNADGKRLRIAYDASREHVGGLMGDPKPGGTVEALQAAGLFGRATAIHHGRHLMHDKFLVRDGESVWTGSANFTEGGLELQDNNCLTVSSAALAKAYTTAFESMLEEDESVRPTNVGTITLSGASVRPLFAPAAGEGIEDAIIELFKGARRVRILAFLLSDAGILEALLPMGRDHTFDIRGVYDPHGMESVLRYTQQAQTHFWFMHDPRFVAAPSHAYNPHAEQDFMHNKVLIVDDRYVLTGSYNFSENAESNDENVLIFDSPALAAEYTAYFDRLATAYAPTAVHAHSHADTAAQGAASPAVVAAEALSTSATHDSLPSQPSAMAPVSGVPTTAASKENPMYGDLPPSGPRPSVFRRAGRIENLALASSQQTLLNEQVVGRTTNSVVYTDGTTAGNASAQAVLKSFEADFQAITAWFGGIQLPPGQDGNDQTSVRTALPIYVAMDPNAGGAYHYGCDATDVYIEPDPASATGLVVAEVVEIFEAAINNGWTCGQTNGESLSRVLAAERNSTIGPLIAQTAQQWWADGAQDFVTDNSADDQNQDANGCGSLFLYYLHSQLNFTWTQIATMGGTSLGDCYQRLTGRSGAQGFSDFTASLNAIAAGGQLQLPSSGNPFPIQAQSQPAALSPARAAAPASAADPAKSGRGGVGVAITVVSILIILVLIALGISLFFALG